MLHQIVDVEAQLLEVGDDDKTGIYLLVCVADLLGEGLAGVFVLVEVWLPFVLLREGEDLFLTFLVTHSFSINITNIMWFYWILENHQTQLLQRGRRRSSRTAYTTRRLTDEA